MILKRLFFLFLFSILINHFSLNAQSSFDGINYQAVARNAAGIIVASQPVKVRFSIVTGNASGTVVYQEVHAVTTTAQGLFTLVIGKGTPGTGTFAAINWATSNHFLKVDIDIKGGNNFSSIGTTPFYSVPFALYAANNMVGPQGPQGPTGATGAQGAQGIPGLPGSTWQINNTTFNSNGTLSINTNNSPATITSNNATWLARGNSGMNAVDYIGTNDNQPFIIKTSGNERMRFATGPQVTINGLSSGGNRLLTVYGSGTPQAINSIPGQTEIPISGFSAGPYSGIWGQNTGNGNGVYGENTNNGAGVLGFNNNSGSALYGMSTGTNGYALRAEASGSNSIAMYGINSSGLGIFMSAYNSAGAIIYGLPNAIYGTGVGPATNTFGARLEGGPTYALVGGALFGTNYGIVSNGAKSTVVKDENGENHIMFCPEAPEVLFQDYGAGQLQSGVAHITLDKLLVRNILVDDKHPLKVFIQLEGDCNGVYVTNKTTNSFDVKELQQGKSNVSFTWQIVATRADDKTKEGKVQSQFANLRFPVMPPLPAVPVDQKGRRAN